MIKLTFPPKLEPLVRQKCRFKIIYGGRGSGKTESVAKIFLLKAMSGRKVACCREFQNSLEDSVYGTMVDLISRSNLYGWTIKANTLEHSSGGKAIFRGLARNPQSIKGLNTFDDCWVEEAQTISAQSLKELTPTFRRDGCEIWFTANPQSIEDPFSQRFIESNCHGDGLHYSIKLNYEDNPWFPETLNDERMWDYKNLDRALYDHIWLGEYNDSVENSIIRAEWFDACIDAHKKIKFKPSGQVICTHDPADTGDARGFLGAKGNIILDIQENKTLDVNEACDWSMENAKALGVNTYVYDSGGIGLSLKRQVNDYFNGTNTNIRAFIGGASVEDPDEVVTSSNGIDVKAKDFYHNLRAQCYGRLADACFDTYKAINDGVYVDPDKMISFSSDISCMPSFKAELCRIPRVYNSKGTYQIMRKDQMMQKLKIKSPNLADCAMMKMINVVMISKQRALPMPKMNIA